MGLPPLSLIAVAYPEAEEWVAHCLDLDLVATATTAEAALDTLAEAIATQLGYAQAHDNWDGVFRPAPGEAWTQMGRVLRGPYHTRARELPGREVTIQAFWAA